MAFVTFGHDTIDIDTSSSAKRVVFVIIVLALTLPPIYSSYRIFSADRIVMVDKTFEGYTRALEYDPSNGALWWYRGRMSHYSLQNPNIRQAVSDYQKALSLNPRIGQAWLDLADCHERLGQYDEAERALDQAFVVRTYSPAARWQAGNYYLRRGNLSKMYENFKMACRYDFEKLPIAMALSWKVDPDHAQILDRLIPHSLQAYLGYLDFLVGKDELDLAGAVWERSIQSDMPRDFKFQVSASFRYIDRLLAEGRVSDALRAWGEALQKAGTRFGEMRYQAASGKSEQAVNLVWNGSFEDELLLGGFDWRFPESPGVESQIDQSNCADGLQCLQLTFTDSSVSAACLSQIVPVPEPGGYTLEIYVRAEGLTASQTPYIAIDGYPDASGASLRVPMPSLSSVWQKVTAALIVKANVRSVMLKVGRDLSSGIDGQVNASLWLDGVAIYRSVGEKQ